MEEEQEQYYEEGVEGGGAEVEEAEGEGWEIETLLEHKNLGDEGDYFLVKWKGFDDPTWEPEQNLGTQVDLEQTKATLRAQSAGRAPEDVGGEKEAPEQQAPQDQEAEEPSRKRQKRERREKDRDRTPRGSSKQQKDRDREKEKEREREKKAAKRREEERERRRAAKRKQESSSDSDSDSGSESSSDDDGPKRGPGMLPMGGPPPGGLPPGFPGLKGMLPPGFPGAVSVKGALPFGKPGPFTAAKGLGLKGKGKYGGAMMMGMKGLPYGKSAKGIAPPTVIPPGQGKGAVVEAERNKVLNPLVVASENFAKRERTQLREFVLKMRKFYRRKKYAFDRILAEHKQRNADKESTLKMSDSSAASGEELKSSDNDNSTMNKEVTAGGGAQPVQETATTGDKEKAIAVSGSSASSGEEYEATSLAAITLPANEIQMAEWFDAKRGEFLDAIFSTKDANFIDAMEPAERDAFAKARNMLTHRGLPEILPTESLLLEALWLLVWDTALPDPEEEVDDAIASATEEQPPADQVEETAHWNRLRADFHKERTLKETLKVSKAEMLASLLTLVEDQLPAAVVQGKADLTPNVESSPVRGKAIFLKPSAVTSPSLDARRGRAGAGGAFGATAGGRPGAITQSPAPNTTSAMEDHGSKATISSDGFSSNKRRKLNMNSKSSAAAARPGPNSTFASKSAAYKVSGRRTEHPDKKRYNLITPMPELSSSDDDLEPDGENAKINALETPPAQPSSLGTSTSAAIFPNSSRDKVLEQGAPKLLQLLIDIAKHHQMRPKNPRRKNLLLTAMELLCKRTAAQISATQTATKVFAPVDGMVRLYGHLVAREPKPSDAHPEVKKHWETLIRQLYQEHNPEKLPEVPKLLAKYRNRERLLYLGICDKYRVHPRAELPEEVKARVQGDAIMPGMNKSAQPHLPLQPTGEHLSAAAAAVVAKAAGVAAVANEHHNAMNLGGAPNGGVVLAADPAPAAGDGKKKGKTEHKGLLSEVVLDEANEEYRKQLYDVYYAVLADIYKNHLNMPEKVVNMSTILKKNQHRYQMLFEGVCDKYKIDEATFKSLSLVLGRKLAVLKVRWTIHEIFRRFNPGKLSDLSKTMEKYAKKEEKLYAAVTKKYNVKPDDEILNELKTYAAPGEDGANASNQAGSVPAGSPGAEASGTIVDKLKQKIRDIYKDKNPSKAKELEAKIFPKYHEKEQDLYQALCKKYNLEMDKNLMAEVEANAGAAGGVPTSGPDNALPSGVVEGAVAVKGKNLKKAPNDMAESSSGAGQDDHSDDEEGKLNYSKLILDLYREHNPTKLDDVPGLLEKYAGQEDELYERVCKKYHVKPKKAPAPKADKTVSGTGEKKDLMSSPESSAAGSPEDDEDKGPFDNDPEYLQHALDVLCVLLKSLSGVFHMSANLHLPYSESANMLDALEKQREVFHKKNDRSYKSLYRASWDFSVLGREQIRDLQVAFSPYKMRELGARLGSRVMLTYTNSLYDIGPVSTAKPHEWKAQITDRNYTLPLCELVHPSASESEEDAPEGGAKAKAKGTTRKSSSGSRKTASAKSKSRSKDKVEVDRPNPRLLLEIRGSNKVQVDQACLLVNQVLDEKHGDSDLESNADYHLDEPTSILYSCHTETYHGEDVLPMYVNRQNVLLDIRTPFDHLRHKYTCSMRWEMQPKEIEIASSGVEAASSPRSSPAAAINATTTSSLQKQLVPVPGRSASGGSSSPKSSVGQLQKVAQLHPNLLDLQHRLYEHAFLPLFLDSWLQDLNAKPMRMKGGIVFNLEYDQRTQSLAFVAVGKSKVALDRIAGQVGETLSENSDGYGWQRTDVFFPPPPNAKAIRNWQKEEQTRDALALAEPNYTSDEYESDTEPGIEARPLRLTREKILLHVQKQKCKYETPGAGSSPEVGPKKPPLPHAPADLDDPKQPLNVRNLVCLQCDTLHDWADVRKRMQTESYDPTSMPTSTIEPIRSRRAWKYCCREEIEKAVEDEFDAMGSFQMLDDEVVAGGSAAAAKAKAQAASAIISSIRREKTGGSSASSASPFLSNSDLAALQQQAKRNVANKFLACVNCHRFGCSIFTCSKKDRWTKRYLAEHEKTEDQLYRRIERMATKLLEFTKSDACVHTRAGVYRMQQLVSKIRQLGGTSVEVLKRQNLPPERVTALVDEIESLQSTDLVFPAEIDKVCYQLRENPTQLHDPASLQNPQNYLGQRDAFGGRQPPLPTQRLEDFRNENGFASPMRSLGPVPELYAAVAAGGGKFLPGRNNGGIPTLVLPAPAAGTLPYGAAAAKRGYGQLVMGSPNDSAESSPQVSEEDGGADEAAGGRTEDGGAAAPDPVTSTGGRRRTSTLDLGGYTSSEDENDGKANGGASPSAGPAADMKAATARTAPGSKTHIPEPPGHPPPQVPDSKFPCQEKIYLDDLLGRAVQGANTMSRILGRQGSNHKRIEQETGTRVFFRGFGVSNDLRVFPEKLPAIKDAGATSGSAGADVVAGARKKKRHINRLKYGQRRKSDFGDHVLADNDEPLPLIPQSELRLHLLIRADSVEAIEKVKQRLKNIVRDYLDGSQMTAESKIHDVYGSTARGTASHQQSHPFFPMVPLNYVYSSEHPVREVKKDWKFQFPNTEQFKDIRKTVEKWCAGFESDLGKYCKVVESRNAKTRERFEEVEEQIAAEERSRAAEDDAKMAVGGDITGRRSSPGGRKSADGEDKAESIQDGGAGPESPQNDSANVDSKPSGTSSSPPASRRKYPLQKRSEWYGRPVLRDEFSNKVLEIPGLQLSDFEACGEETHQQVINAMNEMLADWNRPYWFEPSELVATQSIVHGPLAGGERKKGPVLLNKMLRGGGEEEAAPGALAAKALKMKSASAPTMTRPTSKAASKVVAGSSSPASSKSKPQQLKDAPKSPKQEAMLLQMNSAAAEEADEATTHVQNFDPSNYAYAGPTEMQSVACFPNALLPGHQVALSDPAVEHLTDVLFQSGLLPKTISSKVVQTALRAARGVVRAEKHDADLLIFLKA